MRRLRCCSDALSDKLQQVTKCKKQQSAKSDPPYS
jgi:hypothetical protein